MRSTVSPSGATKPFPIKTSRESGPETYSEDGTFYVTGRLISHKHPYKIITVEIGYKERPQVKNLIALFAQPKVLSKLEKIREIFRTSQSSAADP
jgi:hypothetical protein